MKVVLSIAGSDTSGGAGIQADIKTITAYGLYAETVITALTAQNTTGVYQVLDVEPQMVSAQMDAVFEDIRPQAVKIGMVSTSDIIQTIADRLRHYDASPVVIDPVMMATSGAQLIADEAIQALKVCLFPLGCLLTPNIPEAEKLCGFPITGAADMQRASQYLAQSFAINVMVKGGHGSRDANDVLVTKEGKIIWLKGSRVSTLNTHGTGCTLSSAIACGLAKGWSLEQAARRAKDYVHGALSSGLSLGKGSGPLNHMWKQDF